LGGHVGIASSKFLSLHSVEELLSAEFVRSAQGLVGFVFWCHNVGLYWVLNSARVDQRLSAQQVKRGRRYRSSLVCLFCVDAVDNLGV